MTAITVSSSGPVISASYGNGSGQTFYEPAFSGCGSVNYTLPSKDFRLAKSLGFKKGYRNYYAYYEYYNGQFGDACRAYSDALSEFSKKYPGSIIDKIELGSYID